MANLYDSNRRPATAEQPPGGAAAASLQPTQEAAEQGESGREALSRALGEILPGAVPNRRQGAFIIAAIGNLSLVNESFGFQVGDEVIAIVGARLKGCLRERDTFARYGSNKFGVVLADCEPDHIDFVAGRMTRAVRGSPIETSAGAVSVSLHLGGILVPHQAKSVQDTFNGAFDALEHARARRGDSFVLYDNSAGRLTKRRRDMMIADEIVRALNERRMALALQPVVRAGSRETAFYECLLRMRKPGGDYVPAAAFMPVAEKFGLATLIDHRVAELAVGLLKEAPDLKLSINVSGDTVADADWLALLRGLLQGEHAPGERLMVEIGETAALTDIAESAGFVDALKRIGCRVAIDDFGAGSSSFRNLRRLDADMVKIDGSFLQDMANDGDDRFLVGTLVDLARNFSMRTVAEWVSDETTAGLAEKAGVDFLQGFRFGAPQLVGAHAPAGAPADAAAAPAASADPTAPLARSDGVGDSGEGAA